MNTKSLKNQLRTRLSELSEEQQYEEGQKYAKLHLESGGNCKDDGPDKMPEAFENGFFDHMASVRQ